MLTERRNHHPTAAEIERFTVRGAGVQLVGDAAGPVEAQPILFLHGGGQTRHSWRRAVCEAALRGYRGIALDLRGHGDSGWSPDGDYRIDRYVEDLVLVIESFERPVVLIGASLGGIASLVVAAGSPRDVLALVLVDIAPRIEPRGTGEIGAFMRSAPAGFASIDDAADAVARYLPHRPRPRDHSGLIRNLRLRDGRYHWHWDPRFIEPANHTPPSVAGPSPLAIAARRLTVPTLLIRGGLSRVTSAESAREFMELVPHAELTTIDEADHMVAGDANDAFNDAAFRFVSCRINVAAINTSSAPKLP